MVDMRLADHLKPKVGYVSYGAGFVFSILLTTDAYIMTAYKVFTGQSLIYALLGLAVVQLVVQLVFFLHVGQDKSSRWNAVFLLSTVGIMLIMVTGSLLIMHSLNYRMMPADMNSYIHSQDGF